MVADQGTGSLLLFDRIENSLLLALRQEAVCGRLACVATGRLLYGVLNQMLFATPREERTPAEEIKFECYFHAVGSAV